jgi:hypothetical protein
MSVETSRMGQPGDGDPDDGQRRFAFRSADSAADPVGHDDDLDDDDVVSRADVEHADEDEDVVDDGTLVRGTVVDEDDDAADLDTGEDDEPQPTFTPVADGPFDRAADPSEPTLNETDDVPVVPAQATAPVTEVPAAETAPTGTQVPFSSVDAVDAVDANEPLLADAVGLRASWQQAQAGFVDDPRAAVADAAELVEHTAQTLIGSLQQRQRQLRTQWDDNGSAAGAGTGAGELSDTERLRHLMQDYRSLFNQLCRP